MRTKDEIELEIRELDKNIQLLRTRKHECDTELFKLICPIQIGDLITWGEQGRKGRVNQINKYSGDSFSYIVLPVRKDKSIGYKPFTVYPWKNPRLIEEKSK